MRFLFPLDMLGCLLFALYDPVGWSFVFFFRCIVVLACLRCVLFVAFLRYFRWDRRDVGPTDEPSPMRLTFFFFPTPTVAPLPSPTNYLLPF